MINSNDFVISGTAVIGYNGSGGAVIIPDGIEEAAEYSFLGRSDITSITFPGSMKIIGRGAFSGCSALEELVLPEGLDEIHDGAFFGCGKIKEVNIPHSLNNIGSNAFSGCAELGKISLGNNLKLIGEGVFWGCGNLSEIIVSAENDTFSDLDGVLCRSNSQGETDEIIFFPQGRSGSYSVPGSIKKIGAYAFRGCKNLDEVTVHAGVLSIGDGAFANCESVKIKVEGSEVQIGANAFPATAAIKKKTVNKEKNELLKGMFGAFDIGDGDVEYILPVNKVFVVPEEEWTFENNDGAETVVSYNGSEKQVTVPSKNDEKEVEVIARYAFSPERGGIDRNRRTALSQIRSVFLPMSVKKLEDGIFKNCSDLEYVLVPQGVESMGDRVFSGCSSLTSVTLPENIDTLSNGLFFGCSKLENFELPKGLKKIGELAFANCSRLTMITIPEGVEEIGRKAFSGCRNLMYISIPDGVKVIGNDAFKDTPWFAGRPDGVVYAGKCAVGYKGLDKKISFIDGTTVLCSAIFKDNERITNVVIPDSVEVIEDEAFWGCSRLSQIELPKGLKKLGDHAFSGCRSLNEIVIPEGLEKIGEFALSNCDMLRKVTLPESVKIINRDAFRGCKLLSSIILPEKLERIDDEAFLNCASLREITIPESVNDIGERVFSGTPNIVIHAKHGSYAGNYAMEHGYAFAEI